jgi:hypothetical protein
MNAPPVQVAEHDAVGASSSYRTLRRLDLFRVYTVLETFTFFTISTVRRLS